MIMSHYNKKAARFLEGDVAGRMIEWWRAGRFPFDRLIEVFAFDDIGGAWAAARSGAVIKPVLLF